MIRKYPKPVLCGDLAGASFYKDAYSYAISLLDCSVKSECIELVFSASLNSNYLIDLLSNNKATAYYKVQTNRYSVLLPFNIGETVYHSLSKNILDRIDKIHLNLMIIANDDFTYSNSNELIAEVANLNFGFKKSELMAVSNIETLNYSLSGNPFINISLAESQEDKGLLFSSLNKEVIQIKVGKSLNEAYAKLQLNRDAKDILNPFLAFSAILYSVEKAIYDEDESYKNND